MKSKRLREGQVFTMPGTAGERWRVERVTECSAVVRPVAGGGRPVQISAHAEVEIVSAGRERRE